MAHCYWIHQPHETDIHSQGYVGFTDRDPEIRKQEHFTSGRTGLFEVIAEGTVVEMLALERDLRPNPFIGDNYAVGGSIGQGRTPKSSSMKEKVRQARAGTKQPTVTKNKISQTLTGSNMWITNGSENKFVPSTEEIPNGWQRGRYRKKGQLTRKVVWEGKEYSSLIDASNDTGIPLTTLHRWLKRVK